MKINLSLDVCTRLCVWAYVCVCVSAWVCVCSVNKLATNLFFCALKDTKICSLPHLYLSLSLSCSASRNSSICATATTTVKKHENLLHLNERQYVRAPLNDSFLISLNEWRACVAQFLRISIIYIKWSLDDESTNMCVIFEIRARAAKGWND